MYHLLAPVLLEGQLFSGKVSGLPMSMLAKVKISRQQLPNYQIKVNGLAK
jgi:hypothetical protein